MKKPAVFFDIGDTLGAVMTESGPPLRRRLIPFPDILNILKTLRRKGHRLGIISNTGKEPAAAINAMLKDAGILKYFEPKLRLYSSEVHLEKNSPKIFKLAVQRAGLKATPSRCLFVGEEAQERIFARAAGMKVAPAACLALEVLEEVRIQFLRIHVPVRQSQSAWRSALNNQNLPLAPLHVAGSDSRDIYVMASVETAAKLDNLGFRVDRLGPVGAPDTADLYLLRDDRQTRTGFLAPEGQAEMLLEDRPDRPDVVSSTAEGLFVVLPGTRNIEELHFREARHGHTVKLLPDSTLLRPFSQEPGFRALNWTVESGLADRNLKPHELAILAKIDGALIQGFVDRYSGKAQVSPGKTIRSRHVQHPDNRLAVTSLLDELRGMKHYTLRIQRIEGGRIKNVEAEFRGETDELVLITAHLDSTAKSDLTFRPDKDPAPGADDDASGMAAVLSAASVFPQLLAQGAKPTRTVRFVLFNAEEVGLVGSNHYARALASQEAPVVAVFQMDMVGYRLAGSQAPHPFEIHFGYDPLPDTVQRSRLLAERLERVIAQVAPKLAKPQMYDQDDPASGRSDHASFQQRGYAAVCVSEDAFVGGPSATNPALNNPYYHKSTDRHIIADYAAEVARAVAAAAWLTAQP